MNPEAQRIAIAEACGWRVVVNMTKPGFKPVIKGFSPYQTHSEMDTPAISVPEYLTDLNAMHDAEKRLNSQQQERFLKLLFDNFGERGWWMIAHATATQRAEAFLKTLNLWKP